MDTTERIIKWRDLRHEDTAVSEPRNPLPAVCDVSVTNVCNAACDFCGFSREKNLAGPRRYLDPDEFARALPILRRRRIRYMTLQGGEPLVHPQIASLVASATRAGIQCGVITNGWFLPRHIKQLAEAGLKRLLISIDSADMREHEHNRGLRGLEARIREGITQAHSFGIEVCASITVSRLVRYESLPETLNRLGFDAVVFSYPRREAFGSSSLVYDEDSKLVDLNTDELLDALNAIARLKKHFRVMDPSAALDEVARFVRGERQLVPCIGGSKYFYIDWNLDVWRCEAWSEPMGSVFDLDRLPDQREPCNACMMGCYRHASILMHGAIAVTDSVYALGRGQLRTAVSLLFQRSVAYSLWALSVEELPRASLMSFARRMRGRRSTPQTG
ncbi:radical SAM protein [Paraburkholderia atlantica]|uniref:radical SAM protein n=1 Tax=Paraburkholderia atlantica TaxID=2654982 RepID=UPI00161B18D4|nr:radical SAM protein [Paraburkholderia atlantica]MBB5508312.1 MoaA/NifB/PqqE/SkfB family radical SAM enzyme [Paraburkholderia atlantica]